VRDTLSNPVLSSPVCQSAWMVKVASGLGDWQRSGRECCDHEKPHDHSKCATLWARFTLSFVRSWFKASERVRLRDQLGLLAMVLSLCSTARIGFASALYKWRQSKALSSESVLPEY
jgi:hypothetical protein